MRQILTLGLIGALISCFSVSIVAQDVDKKDEEKTETATEQELFNSTAAAFQAKKFEEAEEGIKELESRFPESLRLQTIRYQGYIAYARSGNMKTLNVTSLRLSTGLLNNSRQSLAWRRLFRDTPLRC